MVLKSDENEPCDSQWRGGKLFINQNQKRIATIPSGFKYHQFCIPFDQVDVKNDQFQLQSSNNNNVCITHFFVDGKQIFVGAMNDQSSFIIDGNQNSCQEEKMSTAQITIQNGEVLSSECKGLSILILLFCNKLISF